MHKRNYYECVCDTFAVDTTRTGTKSSKTTAEQKITSGRTSPKTTSPESSKLRRKNSAQTSRRRRTSWAPARTKSIARKNCFTVNLECRDCISEVFVLLHMQDRRFLAVFSLRNLAWQVFPVMCNELVMPNLQHPYSETLFSYDKEDCEAYPLHVYDWMFELHGFSDCSRKAQLQEGNVRITTWMTEQAGGEAEAGGGTAAAAVNTEMNDKKNAEHEAQAGAAAAAPTASTKMKTKKADRTGKEEREACKRSGRGMAFSNVTFSTVT